MSYDLRVLDKNALNRYWRLIESLTRSFRAVSIGWYDWRKLFRTRLSLIRTGI